MKETINVFYKEDNRKIEGEFNKQCERLDTFSNWRYDGNVMVMGVTFANTEFFIRLGGLQKALKNIAYFHQGHDGYDRLSLSLHSGHSWDEVIDKMKQVDYIEA